MFRFSIYTRRSGWGRYPRCRSSCMAAAFRPGGSPGFPVHARRPLASIRRHSPHGKQLAAERAGQQTLQDTRLASPAFLCCLHDAGLETAHVAISVGPVDLVPLQSVVESCTRRGRRRLSAAPRTLSRHLPCLLCRFAKLCRDERPRGSQLAFAQGNVGDGLNPYPPHYRTAFASSVILYPQPRRLASRLAFPCGRTTGLTRSAHFAQMV